MDSTYAMAHETKDWMEWYNRIRFIYDIDIDNCATSHDQWARLLADAICYPLLTQQSMIDDERELLLQRQE